MNINFMTGSKYEKDSSHVKLMIIDRDGNSYIANRSSDGANMREKYGLDFYDKSHNCQYHIDYLQVLLSKYFSDNKNYQKFIGNADNFNTYGIISKLVEDGYIVFSNNTSYEGITYQINGTLGSIYINNDLTTDEQIEALKNNSRYLDDINSLEIKVFGDYCRNISADFLSNGKNISADLDEIFSQGHVRQK